MIIEIGTKSYSDDRLKIKMAMSHMESLLSAYNGYVLSDPTEKLGWTFFKMALKPELHSGIEHKFSDMLNKYRWSDPTDKFAKFMTDYFNSKGCQVKVSVVPD